MELHKKRMSRILDILKANGAEAVILGAFDCGAFQNSLDVVARAMKEIVKKFSTVRNVLISNCIIKESYRGLCLMCNDESSLVENVRISNMMIDTKIRAGNWWGNGEPIFMMAVKHDHHIPATQHPHTRTECAIRNIHIENVTCTGENAMGVYGTNGNIREVDLCNIDYTRKPSANIVLKGYAFDFLQVR